MACIYKHSDSNNSRRPIDNREENERKSSIRSSVYETTSKNLFIDQNGLFLLFIFRLLISEHVHAISFRRAMIDDHVSVRSSFFSNDKHQYE